MRNRVFYSIIAVVALQTVFFAGWAIYEEGMRGAAMVKLIRVRTVPVDPRDLLSGNYLRLRYEMSTASSFKNAASFGVGRHGKAVWAVLKDEGGYHVPDEIFTDRPWTVGKGRVLVKGRADGTVIEYGVERFFVSESVPEPERAAKVTVSLKLLQDHSLRIDKVFVNDVDFTGRGE